MSEDPEAQAASVTRRDVARGAGLAGLSRLSALIDAIAQPAYTWLFGLTGYGIYVVLWGAVNMASNLADLSMTSALQRVVPGEADEDRAHGYVRAALLLAVAPSIVIAALVSWQANAVAGLFSAAPDDLAHLPRMVGIFVWALPVWTFIEVSTSAARARRAFGPEIRIRLFWEQIARILFACGFFLLGLDSLGLVVAHLCSLTLTAILCIRLLGRYYSLKRLLTARVDRAQILALLGTGLALLPASASRRMLIDAPPVVLNLMIPGARGAAAAGLFEIARKISTVPLAVRQAFQYVMAPLASAQAGLNRAAIGPLYHFASRVSTALVVPLAGLLIFAGTDILSLYRHEAREALPLLYILVAARGIEAIVGPATPIVEMTGHRVLPLLNSLIGVFVWAVLIIILVPTHEAYGMAIANGLATVATAYAATVELRISDKLWPFDRKLAQGLGIGLAGNALMATAEYWLDGPIRFGLVLLLWAATSWSALRLGLTRSDREALGGLSRRLRLI
ncbi:lipopolysaccharide biosynthesis protein [Sphingosinicella sp. BN140058]|uniref:lipopolysaccharide biosynthesis protein n=1 Tax=Sphingosinicella sp. BN140058 TaxID=1892855 RepID=UPI001012E36D|nr:oligosaccharide flippase family protein [Sphingosinicella sp. BN140058]QAY76063.1 polysaccharide biosynthesis protein [Sphingosinicella sp. BN140058]